MAVPTSRQSLLIARLFLLGFAGCEAGILLHIVAVLWTGGYEVQLGDLRIGGSALHVAILLLLCVAVAHMALRAWFRHRSFSVFETSLLVFCVSTSVYLSNGKTLGSGDTLPARLLPICIMRDGSFYLNRFVGEFRRGTLHSLRYVDETGRERRVRETDLANTSGRRFLSAYPVGAPLVAVPTFLITAFGRASSDGLLLAQLEKVAAALIVALSAAFLYLTLVNVLISRYALALTAVYAFGSACLSVSSQALWQHGPSQLALTTCVFCLFKGRSDPRWVVWAGFPLAFSILCRPTDIFFVGGLALYVGIHHRRQFLGFLATSIPRFLQLYFSCGTIWSILALHSTVSSP